MKKKIQKNKGFTPTPFIQKGVSLQSKRGFMLVEIVIVISIIVVSVLAAMSVTQKSIYVSRQALHASQASFLLEEGAEITRILRDNSWVNISGLTNGTNYYPVFSSGTWSLSTSLSTVGIFTRKINIANVNRDATTGDIAVSGVNDIGTKLITITVSWNEGGVVVDRVLSFYIMDIFSS
jgi:Tfp pilus assembly protein PilE